MLPARSLLALAPLLVVVFAPAVALAQPAGGPPKTEGRRVIVHASATVQAKPDMARISFSVMTQVGINTREEADKHVKKIKDALSALAIPGMDILAIGTPITTVTTEDRRGAFNPMGGGGPMEQTTKQAHTIFVVTVRDKNPDKLREKATKLADVASEHGGTSVGNQFDDFTPINRGGGFRMRMAVVDVQPGPRIEWLVDNDAEARQDAIRRAIKVATENARAAVGDGPLQVVEIDVNSHEPFDGPYRDREELGLGRLGMVPVTARVRVTFGY